MITGERLEAVTLNEVVIFECLARIMFTRETKTPHPVETEMTSPYTVRAT
jgi:hypothetical protein